MTKSTNRLKPLLRLWPWLWRYKRVLLAASVALLFAAAATLSLPVALRYLIDAGFSAQHSARIDAAFLAMFGVAAVMAVATALRYYWVTWIGERLIADLRQDVYTHVLSMSPVFFETTRTGEVLSRLTTDTTLIQTVIGSSVSIVLRNVLLFFGGLLMLMVTSPTLTMMILLLIPIVLVPILVYGRKVRELSRASQDRVADTSSTAQEVFSAMNTVQSFHREGFESARYARAVESAFTTALRRIRSRAILTFLAILLMFGAIVLVLWFGAQAVMDGRMSPGELGQFLLYALFTGGALAALSESWGEIQRAAGATERLIELLDTPLALQVPAKPQTLPARCGGDIQFEAVHFAYPSQPQRQVLRDFSLHIRPGETVALVGPSGAGKSTVFQLLQRFYDIQGGQIRLDGQDIAQCLPGEVRERLSIVPQEPVLFADTAMSNIRYGRLDATDEEVEHAAQHAAADAFIRAQPDGYACFLGERGVRLSGGQKQRIAIARALLKNAAVVLLDEATSALDAESEQAVQQALDELTRERTSLVIAHRLATVRSADRIVVMDQGQVVASGTHQELLAQGGLYARLAKLQFRDA
ncbi:MAG: ATP-binding cassette domain-containing protein [Oceanococcus sp.]|nr:MAG: ATP-binding cassette domain-containing protein [Oceanococcus sp.]